jgi:hypothetical protein
MPLGEVRGLHTPALRPKSEWHEVGDDECGQPQERFKATLDESGEGLWRTRTVDPSLPSRPRPQVVATGGNDFGSVDLPLPSSRREFVGHALYAE